MFMAVCVVLMLCFQDKAHAASVSGHVRTRIHHLHPAKPAKKDDDHAADFFDLSPEQQAVIQWILDSAPRLGPQQARQIVLSAYEHAKQIQIDPIEFLSLVRLESRFDPHARSKEDARGLMQVRPQVHRAKFAGRDAYDIDASLDVGTQVLGECLDKFEHNLPRALNCYSGGGGKTYNQLFAKFRHEANHFIALSLFNTPATPPAELPKDEVVYQLALR
jgi:soluble lytic murein transglycosylase-like protein